MTGESKGAHGLEPGSRLGKYTIVREIGRGGMGSVYEARHEELHKAVAIKTLKSEFASQPAIVERFLREGRASSRVRHRHAIEMFDVGEHEGIVFLAMEYLEGEDLAQRLKRGGALPVQTAIDLLLPVLSAIVEAHEVGVVHRDLKPANIFLATTRRGHVEPKVLDFGISRIEDDQNQTSTETMLGTPFFMAPEQVRGAKNTSPLSDQFSLGVILYQCLTGVLPFRGATSFETFQLITQGQYRQPRTLVETIPPAVEASLARTLSTDPRARFPSVAEFARSLCPYASAGARALWEPTFSSPDAALLDISMVSLVSTPPADLAQSVSAPGSLAGASRDHVASTEASRSSSRTLPLALGALVLLGGLSVGLGRMLKGLGRGASPPVAAAVAAPEGPSRPAVQPPLATPPSAPATPPAAPAVVPSAPLVPPTPTARTRRLPTARPATATPGPSPRAPTPPVGAAAAVRRSGPERDPSGAPILD